MSASSHGDFHYEVLTLRRSGQERLHPFASEDPLEPGDVVRLDGRFWLIAAIEPGEDGPARAVAKPARYRLRLRHPDGREELGAFRRFRPDAPQLGHAFTTLEDGHPVGWEVTEQQLEQDEQGDAYLGLIAQRNFEEFEVLPDHELEHTLARRQQDELPEAAAAAFAQAAQSGLSIELVALEPGEEPDWEEAEGFIDALVIEEVEDDLIELCGVDPDNDPRQSWLETVKTRLREDLAQFRADVEGDLEQIEQWSFRDGRIFAAVGSPDDESDPLSGYGWMCRLADAEALGAAGFERVRKAELEPAQSD
ncbi:MAG TPA: hypothetical protein VK488_11185 [Gaiellaceae bacterium]|nr:hypothetical protein [Gaiellaceae bacterium]